MKGIGERQLQEEERHSASKGIKEGGRGKRKLSTIRWKSPLVAEQESWRDIIDPGQRTDQDCARCSRGWWLSDSGSAAADKLSRNNGHTPPKEEGGDRSTHTQGGKGTKEGRMEWERERRPRHGQSGVGEHTHTHTRTSTEQAGLVVSAGCREVGHGLWSQDVPWCGGRHWFYTLEHTCRVKPIRGEIVGSRWRCAVPDELRARDAFDDA